MRMFPWLVMRHAAALALACLWAVGCAPANREELIREALQADPAFAPVLDKHREIANRIDTYEQEFALKRKTAEETIALMRKDLAVAAATVRSKAIGAKKRLQPEREQLGLGLSLASEALRAQQAQRASLGRSITQLRKSLSREDAVLSPEERSRQAKQAEEMRRDAARLDHEIAALKEHARLLKLKLLLIRL